MGKVIELSYFIDIGKKIEDLVYQLDITYIDACILYCERHNLEVEIVAEIINKNHYIKARIQNEAEDLNYLKKQARLPI